MFDPIANEKRLYDQIAQRDAEIARLKARVAELERGDIWEKALADLDKDARAVLAEEEIRANGQREPLYEVIRNLCGGNPNKLECLTSPGLSVAEFIGGGRFVRIAGLPDSVHAACYVHSVKELHKMRRIGGRKCAS